VSVARPFVTTRRKIVRHPFIHTLLAEIEHASFLRARPFYVSRDHERNVRRADEHANEKRWDVRTPRDRG
jgi:hypothetical protein